MGLLYLSRPTTIAKDIFQMLEVEVKSRQVVFPRSVLLLSPMKEKTGSNERPQSLRNFCFLKESEVRRIHLGELYM